MLIRKSQRSPEHTRGFLVYTEADARLDNPHTPAPALARLRRADRHRPLRSRIRDDAPASTPRT